MLDRRSSPPMVSIAEDKSGKDGADSSAGGDGATGCQHYKRKCKFYVSIHPCPPIMKVNTYIRDRL